MAQKPYTLNVGPAGIQLVDTSSGGVIAQDSNPMYAEFVAWISEGNTPALAVEAPVEEA